MFRCDGDFVLEINGYTIINCNYCGFKHVYPLPSSEELNVIYTHDYYQKIRPDYFKLHERDAAWWQQTYAARLEMIKSALSSDGQRFLDVGSGPGLMLQAAAKAGFEALGVEPNPLATDHGHSQGCNVIQDFLTTEIRNTLGRFDAIHSSEVLEHIREPEKMLTLMLSLLKPGGALCIVVPNDFNPLQEILVATGKFSPWWVAPPHHLNYFSHSSLKDLLVRLGFEVVTLTSTFPIELFLLMGDNYVGNEELGAQCHAKRKYMENLIIWQGQQIILDQLYQKLADINIGREIVMIARKPSAD